MSWVAEVERDFVRVAGADANAFLQGQLSQDVDAVTEGQSALAFLLQPQGKVVALLRLTRLGPDELLLDGDAGTGEAVVERLERFKLRTRADVERLDWRCLAVRGPGAAEPRAAQAAAGLVLASPWPSFAGFDVVGPDPVAQAGAEPVGPEVFEAARIDAGVPVAGREITERTIPGETLAVPLAVSFTKGCYTGQELVARVDSRGNNVPRLLRRLEIAGSEVPPAGAEVVVAGETVGEVTSAAWSGERGTVVALAPVRRGTEVPAEGEVRWGDASPMTRILALPAVS